MRAQINHQPRRALKPSKDLPIEWMAEHVLQAVDLKFAIQEEGMLAKELEFTSYPGCETTVEKRPQAGGEGFCGSRRFPGLSDFSRPASGLDCGDSFHRAEISSVHSQDLISISL